MHVYHLLVFIFRLRVFRLGISSERTPSLCRLIEHMDNHGDEYAAEETGHTEASVSEAAEKHDRYATSP